MAAFLTLLGRRAAPAPAPRPRARIVAVSDRWHLAEGGAVHRLVTVRTAAGELVTDYVSDDHPALAAYLARTAAVAA